MLESGRFAGAIEFGRPGRGSNHMMPLFISTPVSGSSTLLPKTDSRVCVSDTKLPSASTTLRCVVSTGRDGIGTSPIVPSRSS